MNKKDSSKAASEQAGANTENSRMSLEEAFEALDDLIGMMDDENISLEDSFGNYKKGLELIKYCNESIGNIEGQLEVLESGDDAQAE